MNFTEIDFASFTELLKSMKKEIEAEINENPKLDDESKILLDSINLLIKELKDIGTYDEMSLDKKKIVLPHLSLIFIFTRSMYEEDEDFDDEEEFEWDMSEESDEDEEVEEEGEEKSKPLPTMKSNSCCGGQDHHHAPKAPKGKK
jgi:hypothetical protein